MGAANPVVVGGFAELTHNRICLILMLCGGVKKWHSKNSYSVEEILLDATELTARCEKLNSGILCSYRVSKKNCQLVPERVIF